MGDLIRWIGGHFSPEAYLFWTRIQASAWTAADVVIIVFLTASINACRRSIGRKAHVVPYLLTALTLIPAAYLPVAPSGQAIFRTELMVTMPHFLMILYLLLANLGTLPAALAKAVRGRAPENINTN